MRIGLAGAALAGFVVLVTPEPSVIRAGTMAAIALLSLALGRLGAGVSLLSLAATVLLLGDPWLATNYGFALSVVATGSLLLLAGLAQVPNDMQEAAMVDGATWWQRLWKVTLPNMKAAIMVALLFRTLDAFRIFDNVFVMTAGAQGTETPTSAASVPSGPSPVAAQSSADAASTPPRPAMPKSVRPGAP